MEPENPSLKVETQEVEQQLIKMTVEIPAEMVEKEFDHAYHEIGKKARIKGFRAGKVPRQVLESYFRADAESHAVEHLIGDAYPAALDLKKLVPASRPRVEPEKLEREKPFRFHATFAVLPPVEAVRYRDLAVEKPRFPVGDEEVETALGKLRESQAELRAIEEVRPVAAGDFVVLDYRLALPGEKKEKQSRSLTVEVGANRFLPAAEEALVGMKRGEEKEIKVGFPENHPQKGLAGKEAPMTIKVLELKQRVLPELSDDFVRGISSYQTVAELTAAIRANLEKEAASRAEGELRNRLTAALRERNPVVLPAAAVEERARYLLELMQANLSAQGLALNLEGEQGKKLWESVRKEAETEIQNELIFDSIAGQEKIEVSSEAVEARLAELTPPGRAGREDAPERDRRKKQVESDLIRERIFEFLLEHAKITS